MRLTEVEFKGYKRLADTSCNVDGKLIAFLGPNESGKTTVLEGLAWLMSRNVQSEPLSLGDRTRESDIWEDAPVKATFQTSDDDRASLARCYIGALQSFAVCRWVDGRVRLEAKGHGRTVAWFQEHVVDALADMQQHLVTGRLPDDGFNQNLPDALASIRQGLNRAWGDKHRQAATDVIAAIDAMPAAIRGVSKKAFETDLASLREALRLMVDHGPERAVDGALLERCPDFLLFSQADRVLPTTYDLASDDLTQPAALQNLLRLGGTSAQELRELIAGGNLTLLYTALRKINSRLRTLLRPLWRETELTVEVTVQGSVVQLLVHELGEDGVTTSLDERSEGLRAFIAMMAFLHDRPSPSRPVLLIDEAESKLHLNAQADLMEILQRQEVAQQVLYTTHSLDCLPPDIGTGLRFVVPTSRHTSELRSNFWSSSKAGFRELHVMAGASRTAYSRFSRAVLTEGPSEMLLLPTLIRKATQETDLFYRVAPGLSNLRADSFELFDSADRTVYLLDGDSGGDTKKKQLIDAGMPADHVLSLPANKAIEDLLTVDSYLQAVNGYLEECGQKDRLTAADLPDGTTRSKSVDTWCRARKIKAGKTIIASRLVNDPDQVELEPEGAAYLKELHAKLTNVLKL
ncbi:AAA family ATPase [Lentzea californiensis]|uniref:AAA family ATPase n=1 Tax=Lentzea californiensis TaxID=438851 RepID=UPI0021641928|nr:AAA family ATPase [Lentzea californiensis]MCR3748262.1 putative ATP-dependent endonuclease of the OLD family, contains P-loop ATPase and TOPRIM domains [Lentzea californiensis]